MTTIGEWRVGISFNPGGIKKVDQIKRSAADLIDLVVSIECQYPDLGLANEVSRLKGLAMTHIEDAAMWAVTAVTKSPG